MYIFNSLHNNTNYLRKKEHKPYLLWAFSAIFKENNKVYDPESE